MEKEDRIENRLAIQTLTGLELVTFDEVLFFKYSSRQRCWFVQLTTGERHKLRMKTGSKMLLSMHPDFVQINQECIINVRHLRNVENLTLKCKFFPPNAEVVLTMSQRYYANFKSKLQQV